MDHLALVQFLHPGVEDTPSLGDVKPWNNSPKHKRNFLVSDGEIWVNGDTQPKELCFWAEWEPEAERVAARPNADPFDPHHFYRPHWIPRSTYLGLQTTDPFVFGDEFLYTVCRQNACPRRLKHLGRGSVILFGSCRGGHFTLDTVFVVQDWVDHDTSNYATRLLGRTSPTFEAVTLGPLERQPTPGPPRLALPLSPTAAQALKYRLYFGATVTNPIAGMFSFFPCLPYGAAPDGFPCPIIDLPRHDPNGGAVVKHGQTRGINVTDFAALSDVRLVWDEVVAQVLGEGLRLGVQAKLPPQRGAGHPQMNTPAAKPGLAPSSCTKRSRPSGYPPPCVRSKGC